MNASGLNRFSLAGRRVLVTGASRGIGRALAEALAAAGASVAVAARTVPDLDDVVASIRAAGAESVAVGMDVADVVSCWQGVDTAVAALGGIDVLFNNAGIEQVCPSLDVDEALWNRILDTNLKGAFFCAQAVARHLRDAGRGGAIVNLCSLTSEVGIPTAVPYGASKSGLLGMTRALAAEWAPLDIRVNAIGPGYFRTAMTEVFYQNTDWQASMQAKIPLGRFGRLDDLAGAAVFLASDASAYMTGQCLYVDGGYLAAL
jgi:NAD(P)-dependent dehydrogenase (short-subunit alcohol dehydrogenase family)